MKTATDTFIYFLYAISFDTHATINQSRQLLNKSPTILIMNKLIIGSFRRKAVQIL